MEIQQKNNDITEILLNCLINQVWQNIKQCMCVR